MQRVHLLGLRSDTAFDLTHTMGLSLPYKYACNLAVSCGYRPMAGGSPISFAVFGVIPEAEQRIHFVSFLYAMLPCNRV